MNISETYTIFELKELAQKVLLKLDLKWPRTNAYVLGLQGGLGAGKTTFTKELLCKLGVKEVVTSPTFVLQKRYHVHNEKVLFENVIHMDAYRILNANEFQKIGWKEILDDPKNLIVVEWPENVKEILPEEYGVIHFEVVSETERNVFFENI